MSSTNAASQVSDYAVARDDEAGRLIRAGGQEVYVGCDEQGEFHLEIIRPYSGGEAEIELSPRAAKDLLRALAKAVSLTEANPSAHVGPPGPDVQLIDLDE